MRQVRLDRLVVAARREISYIRNRLAGLAQPGSAQRLELLQIAKATLAAVLAWLLAGRFLPHASLWIAPATAVIMVHATVYRTLTNGLRKVGAVAVGVMLAGSIGHLLGLTALSLVLVIPPALVAARWHRMGRHGTDVATTAVLLLSFGAGSEDGYLTAYVLATTAGALCGAAVNMLLWPPLYRNRPHVALQRLGKRSAALLSDIAAAIDQGWDLENLDDWGRRARRVDEDLASATSAIADGTESRRYNLRRLVTTPSTDHGPALHVMAKIALHIHAIIRALSHLDSEPPTPTSASHLSDDYAHDYADLLRILADLLAAHLRDHRDNDDICDLRERAHAKTAQIHGRMSTGIRAGDLDHPDGWAVSGSLLTDAEQILTLLTQLPDPTVTPTM